MGIPELIAGAVFLWIAALVTGAYYFLVVRPETAEQAALRQRIRTGGGGAVRSTRAGLLKDVERLSVFEPLDRFLSGENPVATRLRRVIHQSGLKVTGGQVVLGSACLAMLGFFLVSVQWVFPVWTGLLAAVGMALIPYSVLKTVAVRRLRKFEEQFPEAVALIARTLRAGHAFTTGLRFASEELPEPVASEFKLLHDQQTFGLPMSDGLKAFADRLPIIDARFFVTAVLTQMESGGNLAEVLDNLGAVIRERFKIKRQLRVLTAHGRLTGWVLAALPPALASYMFIRNPDHLRILIDDPAGRSMIVVAVLLQILGAFLIHKISNVEY